MQKKVILALILLSLCGCGKPLETNTINDENIIEQDNLDQEKGEILKIKLQTKDIGKIDVGDLVDIYGLDGFKVMESIEVKNIIDDYIEIELFDGGIDAYNKKLNENMEMIAVARGSTFSK